MALICFASQKGAPGTTLTALGVAAAWPTVEGRRKVLLEADADGGCMALRYQLARQPGLVTLAAAGRHGLGREDLWAHAQALPGGLPAIVAPERSDRVSAVLATNASALAPWLAALDDVDVIVDCGRLGPSSPAMPFARHAEVTYFVARPTAEQIHSASERAGVLRHEGRGVAWVLIGDRPYDAAAVADASGLPVAAVLPDDPRTAAALTAGESPARLRRAPLVRSLATFADTIAEQIRRSAVQAVPASPLAAVLEAAKVEVGR